MTSQITKAKTPAAQALAAASDKTSSAAAALQAAEDDIPRAQQALLDAEANVVALLAEAAGGNTSVNMAAIGKARSQVEKAKSDVEWAALKRQAAETALQRANDEAVCASRRVVAEECVAVHAEWNDPENREKALLAQLTSIVTELIPMIRARKALHTRLGQELAHFPDDERRALAIRGVVFTIHDTQRGALMVQVPLPEVADAIRAGVG